MRVRHYQNVNKILFLCKIETWIYTICVYPDSDMAYLSDMISKFSHPPSVRLACRIQHWVSTIAVTLHIDKYVVCIRLSFQPGYDIFILDSMSVVDDR